MPPKKKAEKMSLNDFLGNADFGSWADEMEDFPTAPAPRAGEESRGTALSRAPDRSDRNYPPREELPLPTAPPYTAFVGNLPFDVSERDLEAHFGGSEIKSVKIIKDREEKPKGFGYVEFATLDGLKNGLALSQSSLAGRSIRVSVADPPKEREGGRGFGSSSGGGFDDDRQWRRDGPLPPRDDDRRGFGRPGGGRFSEDGGERGEKGGFGSKFQSREAAPPSIAEETSDWRSNMRASAPPPPQHDKPRFGGGFGGDRFGAGGGGGGGSGEGKRRGSGLNTPTNATFESPRLGPADVEEKWSIGSKFKPSQSQSQSSPERPNEGGERGTFGRKFGGENKFSSDAPDASDDVQDWRSGPRKVVSGSNTPAMGGGATFGKGGSMERSPSTSGPPPRRKLDLLPKTNAPADATTSIGSPKSGEATPASATSTKPNPFGAAKPVDAAAREREISEKMERAKLTATPQQTTSSLAFSRSSSRAGSRQGSRAGSPTRSPRPSALGLGGMGSNTSTPTTPAPPKILSRGGPPSGRGGSFSHGRVGSVGMSPRMGSSEPEGNWRRGSAPTVNPTSNTNANASSAGPSEGGSTLAATPERRASTVRSNFSFAKAAGAGPRSIATPPPAAKPVITEQAEAATAES